MTQVFTYGKYNNFLLTYFSVVELTFLNLAHLTNFQTGTSTMLKEKMGISSDGVNKFHHQKLKVRVNTKKIYNYFCNILNTYQN